MSTLISDRIDTILSDLDDTLLGEDGKISPFTLEVLQECTRQGIRVIPASGRAKSSMLPLVKELQTGLPYIACNGSQIVSANHELIQQLVFPLDVAKDICAFMQSHGCYVQIYDEQYYYYATDCEPAAQYRKATGMQGFAVGDLLSFMHFDPPKILAVNHPDVIAKLLPLAQEAFEGRSTFTISKPYFLEAEPIGASKGEAAQKMSEMLGFRPENTMAFGDSLNDLSLLAFAKHSVAMENGRKEVKQSARYLCASNAQDGLAHFVKDHVLRNQKEDVHHDFH